MNKRMQKIAQRIGFWFIALTGEKGCCVVSQSEALRLYRIEGQNHKVESAKKMSENAHQKGLRALRHYEIEVERLHSLIKGVEE